MTRSPQTLRSIALLTPGITPYVTGGLQRHSFNLAKHLAQIGIKVDLYHTTFSEGQDINALEGMSADERKNIKSIAIPWQAGRIPGHYVRSLKNFSKIAFEVYQERPPVDFIMGQSLTAWSFVEAKRKGQVIPPIAVNFHGYEMFQPRPTLRTKMEAALLRPAFQYHAVHADHVISLGGRLTNLLCEKLGLPSSKVVEIPGATDPALLSPHPPQTDGKRRFVFLGRYERRKGIEELNAAIVGHPEWSEKCEFSFIGAIPESQQLNLPHVSYAGEIRNPAEIQARLRNADVLLCPSHSEGMPNVIMEGMAAGLAILATDVGAVSLLVSDRNGIILTRSTTEGISHAIERFMTMPNDELRALKKESHAHIQQFFWPAIAEQTCATLSELIEQSKGLKS